MNDAPTMFKGLRTVIYGVDDLERGKKWYASAFGVEPYFDQPYYVGFQIGGFELGLDPNAGTGAGGCSAYWGVDDAEAAVAHMRSVGGTVHSPPTDVGEGIRVATVLDPFGNHVGIIQNPHFDPKSTT